MNDTYRVTLMGAMRCVKGHGFTIADADFAAHWHWQRSGYKKEEIEERIVEKATAGQDGWGHYVQIISETR